MKYYFDEPDFENPDNEKLARIIAYIPAMMHIQNIITSKNAVAEKMFEDKNVYNEMIETAALEFYLSGVNEKDLELPWEEDDPEIL
jgi:hypothetical protein